MPTLKNIDPVRHTIVNEGIPALHPRAHYFPSGEKRPSINVDPEKTPSQIAKDITRRLLPEYLPKWKQGVEAQRQRDAYAAAQKTLTEEILSIIPNGAGHVRDWTKDQNTINLNFAGMSGEIECLGDNFCTLKIRSVPCHLAKNVIRLIVAMEGK